MGRRTKAVDIVSKEEIPSDIDPVIDNNADDSKSIDTEDALQIIEDFKRNKKETNRTEKKPIEDIKPPEPEIIKQTDKIQCQYCNKMVNSKTLRYSHLKTCSANKTIKEKEKPEKTPIVKTKKPIAITKSETEPVIDQPIAKEDVRTIRMRNIKEKYNKLVANAF